MKKSELKKAAAEIESAMKRLAREVPAAAGDPKARTRLILAMENINRAAEHVRDAIDPPKPNGWSAD